jgi:hypothetical protein
VVRRLGRNADNAPCRRSVAVGLDAGSSTLRPWLGPVTWCIDPRPPVMTGRTPAGPAGVIWPVIQAGPDVISRHLPRTVRRGRAGFAAAVAIPATAGTPASRRVVTTTLGELNRRRPVVLMDAPVQGADGAGIDSSGTTSCMVLDVGVHDTSDTLPLPLTTVADELHCCVVAAPDPRQVAACGLGLLLGEAQRRPRIWAAR